LKGWYLVKKFLAVLVCFGLVCAMGLGVTGCDKKDEKKTTPTPTPTPTKTTAT